MRNDAADDSSGLWPALLGGALAVGLAVALWPRRAAAVTLDGRPLVPRRGMTGAEFVTSLEGLDLERREDAIVAAFVAGATPTVFDNYVPVQVSSRGRSGTFWAAPWHLAVGTDQDPFHAPLSAPATQRICDAIGQSFPTRAMVDAIARSGAFTRLPFRSFPPEAGHRSLETYVASSAAIERDRAGRDVPLYGYAKDYVITPRRRDHEDRISIYGAWGSDGRVIQGVGLPHGLSHVDYSQKPRLIGGVVLVDGVEMPTADALADPATAHLFSDEGAIPHELQRYGTL